MTAEQERMFDRTKARSDIILVSSIAGIPEDAKSTTRAAISELGFTSAVLVRELPEPNGDFLFEIVDGGRRLSDAVKLGVDTVPAVIIASDVGDDEAHALRVSMNLNRRPNIAEEARSIGALRDSLIARGVPADDVPSTIAHSLGISIAVVNQRLRLTELPAPVMDAVRKGKVAAGVASRIANLNEGQVQELVDRLEDRGRLTAHDVHDVRLARKEAEVAELPFELFSDDLLTEPEPVAAPATTEPADAFMNAAVTLLTERKATVRELRELLKRAKERADAERKASAS